MIVTALFRPLSRRAPRLLVSGMAAVLPALGLAPSASAQTPLPLANWQYSTGEVLAPLGGPVPKWRVTLGAGATLQPAFEGAKRYEGEPSAILDFRYRDIAFLSDGEGLGVNLLHGRGYRAGIAVSYDLGRDAHDDPHLQHLPNISPAPEAKIFGQYFLLPFVLTADLRKAIGGHEGLIGDLGAYVPLPIAHETYLFIGPSLTAADGRYMTSYFGVGAGTGLPSFQPHAGLKSATLGVTAIRTFGEHWLVIAQSAYERLLGDAARSPVSETNNQFVVDLDVGYRF